MQMVTQPLAIIQDLGELQVINMALEDGVVVKLLKQLFGLRWQHELFL